jgi:hypothetical protein
MAVARQIQPRISQLDLPRTEGVVHTTLLELVRTIGEITDDEAEIVATVIQMIRSGTVELTGNFRGEPVAKLLD